MTPNQNHLFIYLILLASCSDTAKPEAGGYSTMTAQKDSTRSDVKADSSSTLTNFARLTTGDHEFALVGTGTSSYFVHIDRKSGKSDTLETDLDNLGNCGNCDFVIRDMTDSFGCHFPIVQIVTPALDIYYANSFIAYRNGVFQKLFSIEDTEEKGIRLRRNGSKLVGHRCGRDEIVDNLEFDYIAEVDDSSFQVKFQAPDKQRIGMETEVLESFRGHRVIGGVLDSSLMEVKAGTTLVVDTFYRSLGKVRVNVGDSAVVEIRAETAKKKLDHNHAG